MPADDRDRSPSATYSEWAGSAAERRRLTVLFCDLVGSTDLSTRLDPEDMREVIGRYLDVVSATVARFGGHVARLIGDGILVYFGWPQAHEEQVERSVIAGLELIASVAGLELAPELRLSCRVGIATGEVVVGELANSNDPREAVVGSTPNLAARLQGFAEPGQLLIDEATKVEISAGFRVEAVGPLDMRGFAEKVSAWKVVEASTQETRFARRDHGVSPLIGRETELALLLDRWRRAAAGMGQVVLVCGEAGIGKSRLVEALADSIGPAATFDRLGYQCAPLHSDTPLYPIMQQMTRVFGFAPQESAEHRRARLDAALRPLFPDKPDVIERFASLFSLPVDKMAAPRGEPPSLERKRIREALIELTKLVFFFFFCLYFVQFRACSIAPSSDQHRGPPRWKGPRQVGHTTRTVRRTCRGSQYRRQVPRWTILRCTHAFARRRGPPLTIACLASLADSGENASMTMRECRARTVRIT